MTLPELSLYIHLPWCERKCPYCDFNSHEFNELPEAEYVDALLRDLEFDAAMAQERVIRSVFIGGGTPSLFSAQAVAKLIHGVRSQIALDTDVEITLESNPGSAEAEKFAAFAAAGITRLSIGVQSFDDQRLHALGRVHDSAQAHAACDMAVKAGFHSVNIDLMHGLPGQNANAACSDLKQAIDHRPNHLSWYQLTIEPNTVFHKQSPELPDEDVLVEIQAQGEAIIAANGFEQYEVSAYARAGHRCQHNLNYWTFGDYLGIGAGAHGKVTFSDGRILRYNKTRQPSHYLNAQRAELTVQRSSLKPVDVRGEFALNALRLNEGFSLKQFVDRTGLEPAALEPTLSEFQKRGFLKIVGDQVSTTDLGRRFLDDVVSGFFSEI
ncbi:MAG: radical SAM family heme chaperone HemW [Pseudomonadota bacterium]